MPSAGVASISDIVFGHGFGAAPVVTVLPRVLTNRKDAPTVVAAVGKESERGFIIYAVTQASGRNVVYPRGMQVADIRTELFYTRIKPNFHNTKTKTQNGVSQKIDHKNNANDRCVFICRSSRLFMTRFLL